MTDETEIVIVQPIERPVRLVAVTATDTIVVIEEPVILTAIEEPVILRPVERPERIIAVAEQGPPGPPGPGGVTSLPLGETASAYRIVYAGLDGFIYLASNDDVLTSESVRGITIQAGNEGDYVNVIALGEVENSSWNWSGNQNLYLGVDGVVTNVAPVSGYSLRVGYSIEPQKMFMSIGPVIFLT